MIELIAICQNNPYVLAVMGVVIFLSIGITMYTMQVVKDVKAIPTPHPALMTLIAILTVGGLSELGSYMLVGFVSGVAGFAGAAFELAVYIWWGNIEPERKALRWAVEQTAGRVTALVDNGKPHPVAQKDYTNE